MPVGVEDVGRPRLTLRSMLVGIAILAVACAALRGSVGTVLAACVSLLAWKRTSEGIAEGLATSFRRKVALLLTSTAVAATIIGLSAVTFVIGFGCGGIFAGGIVAWAVTTVLRKSLWPIPGGALHQRDVSELGLRPFGVAFAAIYGGVVGLFVLLTVVLSPGGPRWSEVPYGPAITAGSCFLLAVFGLYVEDRIRGGAPDDGSTVGGRGSP